MKILAISGSLRSDSLNAKLVRAMAQAAEKELGASVKVLPQAALDMPLMNEDLEVKSLPGSVLQFRKELEDAQIVLIASPEYNGMPSGALKNAIDWATRPPKNLWEGKIVVIGSASPGALGGARGLIALRTLLSGIKAWVIPEQVQCPAAHEAFDGSGQLKDFKQVNTAMASLKRFSAKML